MLQLRTAATRSSCLAAAQRRTVHRSAQRVDPAMQKVAESVSHDISRYVQEDKRLLSEFETAREAGVAPGDVHGYMEVPGDSYKLARPEKGPLGFHVNELPLRVTDQWLQRPDLTEPEYSAALIHGRSVHEPVYHKPTHNIPVAAILFRSHHLDLLDVFTHFTVHAAAALGIPCCRPVPMPVRRRLWTVIKSPFIFKKSQENYERRIHSRSVKAWDAEPEVIDRWIGYLETHMIGGVGMRVTRWEHAPVGAGVMRAAYVKKEINKEIPADSHHMAHARDVLNVRDQVLLEQEHRMASQDQQNVILKTQDVEWENATAGHLWEPPTRTTTDVPAETKKAAPWVDLAPDEEPAPLAGIEIKDELPSEPNEAGAWEQHVLPKPAEPREEIFLQTEPAQAWEEAFSLHDLEVDQSSSAFDIPVLTADSHLSTQRLPLALDESPANEASSTYQLEANESTPSALDNLQVPEPSQLSAMDVKEISTTALDGQVIEFPLPSDTSAHEPSIATDSRLPSEPSSTALEPHALPSKLAAQVATLKTEALDTPSSFEHAADVEAPDTEGTR